MPAPNVVVNCGVAVAAAVPAHLGLMTSYAPVEVTPGSLRALSRTAAASPSGKWLDAELDTMRVRLSAFRGGSTLNSLPEGFAWVDFADAGYESLAPVEILDVAIVDDPTAAAFTYDDTDFDAWV